MRTLDLSSTNLRSRDLSYFMSEISDPAAGIRLQTLNLSENPTVNDSVLKTVSYLFETSPTLQQFIFDKTSITITGLLHVLDALKDKRSIRRLSTKDNNLTLLQQQHGQQVVERLKSNFSLTELNYEHNFFDQEFAEALKSELEINKKIVRIILPQLSEQEQTAQKKKQLRAKQLKQQVKMDKKRQKRTRGDPQKQRSSLHSSQLELD